MLAPPRLGRASCSAGRYLAGRLGSLKGDLASAQERLRAQDEELKRRREETSTLSTQLRNASEDKAQAPALVEVESSGL